MGDLAINARSKLRNDIHIVFWAEAALLDIRGDRYYTGPEPNSSKTEYRRIGYSYSGRKDTIGVQDFILIRLEAYNDFADDD